LVISGAHPIKSAYYAVKSRSLDMNVLMSTAAIGAAIIGEWFEGATVVWLFSLGIFLQNKSMDQTRKSIRNLMDMAPSMAVVKIGEDYVERPVEEISVGQMIMVRPGDKIPLDGKIATGSSSVNQAPITGESLPIDKALGDDVYAGTLNESGAIEIEVTKLVEDTTLSQIIHLVRSEEISVGQMIMVRPGDKIPLDGKIATGSSSVNQAPITGESLPIDKALGDDVYAGTLNESGAIEIEVTKLVEDTTLSQIIHLV